MPELAPRAAAPRIDTAITDGDTVRRRGGDCSNAHTHKACNDTRTMDVFTMSVFTGSVFTFCNLAPRAKHHHAWYQKKIEGYPASRSAMIPFLW